MAVVVASNWNRFDWICAMNRCQSDKLESLIRWRFSAPAVDRADFHVVAAEDTSIAQLNADFFFAELHNADGMSMLTIWCCCELLSEF